MQDQETTGLLGSPISRSNKDRGKRADTSQRKGQKGNKSANAPLQHSGQLGPKRIPKRFSGRSRNCPVMKNGMSATQHRMNTCGCLTKEGCARAGGSANVDLPFSDLRSPCLEEDRTAGRGARQRALTSLLTSNCD